MKRTTDREEAKAIGTFIRNRRRELGLSHVQLADIIGVSHQQVNKYELGYNDIRGSFVKKLCSILMVSPNEMFMMNKDNVSLKRIDMEIVRALSLIDNVEFKTSLLKTLKTMK